MIWFVSHCNPRCICFYLYHSPFLLFPYFVHLYIHFGLLLSEFYIFTVDTWSGNRVVSIYLQLHTSNIIHSIFLLERSSFVFTKLIVLLHAGVPIFGRVEFFSLEVAWMCHQFTGLGDCQVSTYVRKTLVHTGLINQSQECLSHKRAIFRCLLKAMYSAPS